MHLQPDPNHTKAVQARPDTPSTPVPSVPRLPHGGTLPPSPHPTTQEDALLYLRKNARTRN